MVVVSINGISANELVNGDSLNSSLSQTNIFDEEDYLSDDLLNQELINPLTEIDEGQQPEIGEEYIIYVGQNITDDGGNGSYENPFANLTLASNNVNGQDKVTVNIFNGTYYLGSILEFNTNNLHINGINGKVIIKNVYNRLDGLYGEAFSLNSNANFTMSNIVFDATTHTQGSMDRGTRQSFFCPLYGSVNLAVFNNCSFIKYDSRNFLLHSECNTIFSRCYIQMNELRLYPFNKPIVANSVHIFNYCQLDITFSTVTATLASQIYLPCNISMNNCWFGQNSIPEYISSPQGILNPDGTYNTTYSIPVNRYAQLSISSNYLGNNQYEILGKLTWNGTDDQDGMENFQPMAVKLTSDTGEINSTAKLINGNFRSIYTSSNTNHKINYILDNVDENLEFVTVNITAKEASIYYGEDQNITVNLTQAINNNVAIVVSNATFNKTYIVKVNDSSSFTYTIPDRLKAGTYDINITLSEGNLVGFNTTTLTVSKVSDYTFEVVPNSPKFGENATITITLPDDVNGTVIVKLGNETLPTLEANQTMDVNFAKLNVDTYNITVTYSGSDKYTQDEKTASLTVDPAESSVEINDAAFTYGETIAIPFNITNAIGVNVTVYNKDDDEVAIASSTSGIITLETLPASEYSLYVKTVVDDEVNYQWADATVNLTINKANSTLEISDKEFAYAAEAVINAVTVNSTGDLIVTLTDENNIGISGIDVSGDNITLPLLDVGKYTLNVTTNVDENHNNVTKSATITIIKTTPLMNVTVEPTENITAKDNPTLAIQLPSDATGEIVVKVNGKKVQDSSANETITINLNNAPGDYVVEVIYSGDKNYESDSKTKEFTISKAETTITAKQIDFVEGNASKIEVTVPNVESGIVLVDVEGKKFYGDINKGKTNITLEGLPEGNYTANIKFFGDEIYKEATCTASVKVSEPKIITELKEQLEEAQANATQLKEDLDELNQTIVDKDAEISNLTEAVAGKDAEISNLTDVVAGKDADIAALNDTVIAQNSTIENQKEQISNLTHKKDTILVVDETFTRVAVDYNAGERGGMFYAILKDSEGNVLANKTVQIAINGKIYNKTTDDEGKAGIQVNFANANTYSYAVSFQGDDKYNAAPMASSKLTVTKKKTTIKASNKVFKAKTKTKKISVTLKTVKNQYDNKTYLKSGKKVTLKVNGKTYTAKINKKGVAKFTIKITKKGKYSAKIKFAGDKTYKASSKSIKIRIK
jgi:uncharacterized coiled-coil protein SlyX